MEKEGGTDEAYEDAKQRLRGLSREVASLQEQVCTIISSMGGEQFM